MGVLHVTCTVILITFIVYSIASSARGFIQSEMDKTALDKFVESLWRAGVWILSPQIAAGLCSAGTFLGRWGTA